MRIKKLQWLECLTILLFTFGCTSGLNETSTPTFPVTKIMPSPSASSIVEPSAPNETPTLKPPTITPFPVLTAEQSKEELLELLRNNGGCQLPCLLGHTPGITTQEEMDQFFNQFSDSPGSSIVITRSQGPNRKAVQFYFPQSNLHFNAGISARKNKDPRKIAILGMGTFLTGQQDYPWSSSYYEDLRYFMLPQILTTYGKPSKVLIWTLRDDRSRPDITTSPFFVSVIYPEKGVYLEYEMERQTRGNNFIGCPSKSFVDVAVWDPEDKEAFEQVIQIMNNGIDLSPYKSLEDATSMTIDEFTETFSNPGNIICLETPIEIWPNP